MLKSTIFRECDIRGLSGRAEVRSWWCDLKRVMPNCWSNTNPSSRACSTTPSARRTRAPS